MCLVRLQFCEHAPRRLDHEERPLLVRETEPGQSAEEAQPVHVNEDDIAAKVLRPIENVLTLVLASASTRVADGAEFPDVAVAPVDDAEGPRRRVRHYRKCVAHPAGDERHVDDVH